MDNNGNVERSEAYVERCRYDIIKTLKAEKTKSQTQAKDTDDSWNQVEDSDVDDDDDKEDFDEKFHILLSTVRALVNTNNEIWERCQPYKTKHTKDGRPQFYRSGFMNVRAYKRHESCEMEFSTISQLGKKLFPCFSRLPETLSKIFPVETSGTFRHYDDYLVKITWLAKPIAYQFLLIFKEHLETIQLELGNIETWITEPTHSLQFINTQFGTDLDWEDQGSKCTLKKVTGLPTQGSMDMSFECSSQSDQESLKHFMKFVECKKSDEEH